MPQSVDLCKSVLIAVLGVVGWLEHVNAAAALLPGNLPQISEPDFMRAMGDGKWEEPSWVEAEFAERGLSEVQVTPVQRTIAQEISGFCTLLKGPLSFIMARFWTEEQRLLCGARFGSTLHDYLVDLCGERNQVEITSMAVIATGRKPY